MSRERLDNLLRELARCREEQGPPCQQNYQQGGPKTKVLHRVPLVHGLDRREALDDILRAQALRSRQALGRTPLPHQALFETTNAIYTAAGVLHPNRTIALVLSPQAEERSRADASPWDSGWFHKEASGTKAQIREVFLLRSLPAPFYREYLVDYVATCFTCPQDYLNRRSPRFKDPAGIFPQEDRLSRAFEVRFADTLPLDPGRSLLAVIAPFHGGGPHGGYELAAQLRQLKVQLLTYPGSSKEAFERVARWIHDHLQLPKAIINR